MINNFILSTTNAEEAMATLHSLIIEPWTVLVVFGNSKESTKALKICHSKINSGHPYYAGVRCVHIAVPALVMPWLRSLHIKPDTEIDLDNIQNYLIISISAVYNNVGYAYSTQKYFEYPEAKTDRLVLKAQAADLSL